MEHHRLRKYRGPETWARVKAAYVAGESAPSVARRFDVGLSNLRRRALKEGWTRKCVAEALDFKPLRGEGLEALDALPEAPAIDPRDAIGKAVRRAAWLVSEGRGAEATALLRADDALKRLGWAAVRTSGSD